MRSLPLRIARGIAIALVAIAVFGMALRYLWNWLMPQLFSLHPITFWQALGLIAISAILFRRGLPGGPFRRAGIGSRWANMTPEQREQFRRGMATRCGRMRVGADESASTQPSQS